VLSASGSEKSASQPSHFRLRQPNLGKDDPLEDGEILPTPFASDHRIMEALAAIGLVGNIVQFVDFSGKLVSKSVQLYYSNNGALVEHVDIETATKHLAVLNKKLKDDAISVGDGALQSLCLSCQNAAIDLLVALDQVKVKATKVAEYKESVTERMEQGGN
jgi:hypothetical protein